MARFAVFGLAALSACAGAPAFDAVGVAPSQTAVVDGVPFVISELAGSRVVLGPDPARSRPAFQAVVENRSAVPIAIGPDNIRLRTAGRIMPLSAFMRGGERLHAMRRRAAEAREPRPLGAEAETTRVDAQPWYRDEADFAEASGVALHVRRGAPCLACLAAATMHLQSPQKDAALEPFARRTLSPGETYASLIALDQSSERPIEIEIEVGSDTHRFRWRRSK